MIRHVPALCRSEARAGEFEFMATSLFVGLSRGCRLSVKISLEYSEPLRRRSARGTRNHALDYAHISHRIGKGGGDRRVVDNRAGECIGLQRVLVADFETDFLGSGNFRLRLKPQPAGPIWRGVERNLNIYP